MIYPQGLAYEKSMRRVKTRLVPAALKVGTIYKEGIDIWSAAGSFSTVFRMRADEKDWALRCFTADIGDAAEIYDAIQRVLRGLSSDGSPYFVEFKFHHEGILVDDVKEPLPLIQMEWVEGPSLHQWVMESLNEPAAIRDLAGRWRAMLRDLGAHGIAHGDLQPTNVLITGSRRDPQIKLIDYDTFVVPGTEGRPEPNGGVSSLQHPRRVEQVRTKDRRVDAFSGIAIYASLVALAERPGLWNQFDVVKGHPKDENQLLFRKDDFAAPETSPVLAELDRLGDECQMLARALRAACALHPLKVPPLDAVLAPLDEPAPVTKPMPTLHDEPEPVPSLRTSWFNDKEQLARAKQQRDAAEQERRLREQQEAERRRREEEEARAAAERRLREQEEAERRRREEEARLIAEARALAAREAEAERLRQAEELLRRERAAAELDFRRRAEESRKQLMAIARRDEYLQLAQALRSVSQLLVVEVAIGVVLFLYDQAMGPLWFLVARLLIGPGSAITSHALARRMMERRPALITAVFAFIPCLGFAVMVGLIRASRARLSAAGVQTRLLGPKPEDIS